MQLRKWLGVYTYMSSHSLLLVHTRLHSDLNKMRLRQQDRCSVLRGAPTNRSGLDEGVPMGTCQLRKGGTLHMKGHQLHPCSWGGNLPKAG